MAVYVVHKQFLPACHSHVPLFAAFIFHYFLVFRCSFFSPCVCHGRDQLVHLDHPERPEIEELLVLRDQMVLMVLLVHPEKAEEMDFLERLVLRETEDCREFQDLKELVEIL